MALDVNAVRKIAFLARLKVPDSELVSLGKELNSILGWVEQLSEVNTEKIAPMTSLSEISSCNRKDELTDGNCRHEVLSNAPYNRGGFFAVPKVVE